jgi:CRISPR-associated protein Csy2
MLNTTGLLIIPRLRIQNANAISSPLTWGFPSITAFMGLMWRLEREMSLQYMQSTEPWYSSIDEPRERRLPISFQSVGVICHSFQAQVSEGHFVQSFHLTRNPLDKLGETKSIAQEGRVHLDITLLFGVTGSVLEQPLETRSRIAELVARKIQSLRVAGGTVVEYPVTRTRLRPDLLRLNGSAEKRHYDFRVQRRSWLPGSALVSRKELLLQHHKELQEQDNHATILDAWMDLSRHNSAAIRTPDGNGENDEERVEWKLTKPDGWIVPIPVGYRRLEQLQPPGSIRRSRDNHTPACFVESIYSIGEWVGVHRLSDVSEMLWHADSDSVENGIYQCVNHFTPSSIT